MKTVSYDVMVTNGKMYTWTFTECEPQLDDYGNKMYINIESPSGDNSLIDCRYICKYYFNKIFVVWLINYYGENLDELSEAE